MQDQKPQGGRPRLVPVFHEGKQAQDNFLQAMQRIIKTPKQTGKKKRAA